MAVMHRQVLVSWFFPSNDMESQFSENHDFFRQIAQWRFQMPEADNDWIEAESKQWKNTYVEKRNGFEINQIVAV